MGLKQLLVDSCLPLFIRKKKRSNNVEKKVKKKWEKPEERAKHDNFKSEKGGVSFEFEVPQPDRPETAAGRSTPRPASHANLMQLEDLDGETRYKSDVYKRRERLLSARSSRIKETNEKKRAACLERKKKQEEEFRSKSRVGINKKAERCHAQMAHLEMTAKGSRGRVRLYSAVRRAKTINAPVSATKSGASAVGDDAAVGAGADATNVRADVAPMRPGQ